MQLAKNPHSITLTPSQASTLNPLPLSLRATERNEAIPPFFEIASVASFPRNDTQYNAFVLVASCLANDGTSGIDLLPENTKLLLGRRLKLLHLFPNQWCKLHPLEHVIYGETPKHP